jgi:hypothetical protein
MKTAHQATPPSLTSPSLGTTGFYLTDPSKLGPPFADQVLAHRVLSARDSQNSVRFTASDPVGLRALDFILQGSEDLDSQEVALGSSWREPRGGKILLKALQGEYVDCSLCYTNKHFLIRESGKTRTTYRIARESDLAQAGVSLHDVAVCSNVALPKTQQHSFVSNALSSIRRCQLIPVAQIAPANALACCYLAQALHTSPFKSDRTPRSSNHETIELHRRNRVGGIAICSARAPLGHILYQSNQADVQVRSIKIESASDALNMSTGLAVLTTLALARSGVGGRLVFEAEANKDIDQICHQVGLCSSELGIEALPGVPRTFNLPTARSNEVTGSCAGHPRPAPWSYSTPAGAG